jgi:MoaA/NifB/PqqE/SkfB family radical SAM enzyme
MVSETRTSEIVPATPSAALPEPPLDKLWIYVTFGCNQRCAYCVTESSPEAPERLLDLSAVQTLVDEAVGLGFRHIFLTGGEPFLHPQILDMLSYASARLPTTVLTNASLLRGDRLRRLCTLAGPNLTVQVSLDGERAEAHDPYRGAGTWARAVEGIRRLRDCGIRVAVSSTETPENQDRLDDLRAFVRVLGVAERDHFVRPLARGGFSQEGQDLGPDSLEPELTVTADGMYWHPLLLPGNKDMRVADRTVPLADALTRIQERLAVRGDRKKFT